LIVRKSVAERIAYFLRHLLQSLSGKTSLLSDTHQLFFGLDARAFDLLAGFNRGFFQSLARGTEVPSFDLSRREGRGDCRTHSKTSHGHCQRLLLQDILSGVLHSRSRAPRDSHRALRGLICVVGHGGSVGTGPLSNLVGNLRCIFPDATGNISYVVAEIPSFIAIATTSLSVMSVSFRGLEAS
jgi:hypothetical protein